MNLIRISLLAIFAASASGQTKAPVGPPPPPAAIAKLAGQAIAAKDANELDKAVMLYKQALRLAPRWEQGWWDLGTIYYDGDKYPECRDAFRRFAAINPKLSAGLAFLGLCEFQTRDFGPSLDHLEKAYVLGMPIDSDLTRVTLYHAALLQAKTENYERAIQICRLLARLKPNDAGTTAVAGIAGLRRPLFPHELPDADKDLAVKLGTAMLSGGDHPVEDAVKRFDALLKEYPSTPSVHYAYAIILLGNDPDRAIQELKRELEISPSHLPALISIAFEYLKRGEAKIAQPYAEKAVQVAPGNFAARTCLGRVFLEREDPDLAGATRELETAAKLAPDSPQVHFSLAAAYARAHRKQDAERERAEFARLKELADKNVVQEVR
jgi:tetratricopeptide (TPR) repeat protein